MTRTISFRINDDLAGRRSTRYSYRSLPPSDVGGLVRALAALLDERPGPDELVKQTLFLRAPVAGVGRERHKAPAMTHC